jgi:hypothetical protein
MNAMSQLVTVPNPSALFPTMSDRVERWVDGVAQAIAGVIDTFLSKGESLLANTTVMPFAGIIIAGTNCGRPMLRAECHRISERTGMDVVLLRLHPDRGVTFDVVLSQPKRDLLRYRAWRKDDGDLWLIPDAADGPYLRLTAWGIDVEASPPFQSAAERNACLIRANNPAAFAGRW